MTKSHDNNKKNRKKLNKGDLKVNGHLPLKDFDSETLSNNPTNKSTTGDVFNFTTIHHYHSDSTMESTKFDEDTGYSPPEDVPQLQQEEIEPQTPNNGSETKSSFEIKHPTLCKCIPGLIVAVTISVLAFIFHNSILNYFTEPIAKLETKIDALKDKIAGNTDSIKEINKTIKDDEIQNTNDHRDIDKKILDIYRDNNKEPVQSPPPR